MPALPITSMTASIAAIMLIVLSAMVGIHRTKTRILLGSGTDDTLLMRIRAQGNFIEYVPMALILLGLVEIQGGGSTVLWAISGLLIVGRALHAIGMLASVLPARGLGMGLTFASMLTAIGALFWR